MELIRAADRAGAAVVEIGFPYSDSVADGPVIQESFNDVLSRGFRVADALRVAADVRPTVHCALVAMLSYTLIYRFGEGEFVREAKAAGFDGIIVPDCPVEESASLRDTARGNDLAFVGLIAPTSSSERRRRIASESTGFVYKIARAGITGERADLPPELEREVADLRGLTTLPICVGFGISTPEQVRAVCRVADGVIVGSAVVRRIREAVLAGRRSDAIVQGVGEYLGGLMAGVEPGPHPL